MCNLYYVVGSYNHPIGSVDYINALDIFFKKTNPKFKLIVSTKIIKNEINIFLESFNDEYIDYMKNFKNKFPDTKYIVICTEFMKFMNEHIFFNCFNENDFKDEKNLIIRDKLFVCDSNNIIESSYKISRKKIIYKFKEFIRFFSNKIFRNTYKIDKYLELIKNYKNKNAISSKRKEYFLRANCLLDIFSCVDLFLCSHPEITKSVKKIFNKNALDFPYYVDDIDNKITNKKLNGFYIGGTLNEYRKLFLGKKGKYIISMDDQEVYEKYFGNSNNKIYRQIRKSNLKKLILDIKLKADLEDLSYELNKNIFYERYQKKENESKYIFNKINPELYPNTVESLLKNYIFYYKTTSINLSHLLYELYIPQAEDWPYSSPMRFWHTFMNNSIPVTFKKYTDHPLNMLVEIYRENMIFNIEDFSLRVIQYNKSQKNLFDKILLQIEEMNNNK